MTGEDGGLPGTGSGVIGASAGFRAEGVERRCPMEAEEKDGGSLGLKAGAGKGRIPPEVFFLFAAFFSGVVRKGGIALPRVRREGAGSGGSGKGGKGVRRGSFASGVFRGGRNGEREGGDEGGGKGFCREQGLSGRADAGLKRKRGGAGLQWGKGGCKAGEREHTHHNGRQNDGKRTSGA